MQVQSKTLNSPKLPMGANRVSVLPDPNAMPSDANGMAPADSLGILGVKRHCDGAKNQVLFQKKHVKRQLRGTPPPPLAHGVHGITPHGWKGAQCIF